jgi:hypothetical protein
MYHGGYISVFSCVGKIVTNNKCNLTPEIINVSVTLTENRAMVDWSIGEDVEEKVVEMESKVKKP